MDFAEVVETVEAYISSQSTYFVLESLEALRKNGRLSNLKAFVATALKIKPVMGRPMRVRSFSWIRQEESTARSRRW